ncbi:uncharacterized protein LOC122256288 [Penaeus japonicus]|uniref:uncharacterized protein LOC122256288 n=1 Tax=Penaeus japonicus TaxID=27405 RepID=UPI001C716F8E|nr:uncharacterized protein LOC122256288 [Penaeus japonicus]
MNLNRTMILNRMITLLCKEARGFFCLGIFLMIFFILQKYNVTSTGTQVKSLLEAGNYIDSTSQKERDFNLSDASAVQESDARPKLHEETDKLYRQVESDVFYTKQYVLAKLTQLRSHFPGKDIQENLNNITEDVKHYFRVMQYDLRRLRTESGLHAWQKKEVEQLTDLMQHRIHVLQNPPDCQSAKKIICDLPVSLKVSRNLCTHFDFSPICHRNVVYGLFHISMILQTLVRGAGNLTNSFLIGAERSRETAV